jgi:DNA replication protein DnaC
MSGGTENCTAKGGGACPYGQTWAVTTARPSQVAVYKILQQRKSTAARGLYLHGGATAENPHGVGTGKTRALRCMVNAALDAGLVAEIVRSVDLFARLRATYKDGAEESDGDLLARWARVDVLAVDDLGSEHSTPTGRAWAADRLLRIIDARDDAGRPTLWASNYTVGEVCQRWGGADGARILSRITGGTHVAALAGPDNRVAPQTPRGEKA